MAKKKKDITVAVAEGKHVSAEPAKNAVLPVSPKKSLMAMLGGAAQVKSEKKSGTDQVSVDAELQGKIRDFIGYYCDVKTAESYISLVRPEIEERLTKVILDHCRNKGYVKTLNIDNLLSFGGGVLSITPKATETGLREAFKELYDTYFERCMTLSIRSELFADDDAQDTKKMAVVELLQAKLGDDFARLFEFSVAPKLKMQKVGSEEVQILTKDYFSSEDSKRKIDPCLNSGLLKVGRITLSPSKEGVASINAQRAERAEEARQAANK